MFLPTNIGSRPGLNGGMAAFGMVPSLNGSSGGLTGHVHRRQIPLQEHESSSCGHGAFAVARQGSRLESFGRSMSDDEGQTATRVGGQGVSNNLTHRTSAESREEPNDST